MLRHRVHLFLLMVSALAIRADILTITNQGNTPVPIARARLRFDPSKITCEEQKDGSSIITFTFVAQSQLNEEFTSAISYSAVSDRVTDPKQRATVVNCFITRGRSSTGNYYGRPATSNLAPGRLVTESLQWRPHEKRTIVRTFVVGKPPTPGGMGLPEGWQERAKTVVANLPSAEELRPQAVSRDRYRAVQETEISMVREVVRIQEDSSFKVTCTFEMQSHAKVPLERTVGFPINDPRGRWRSKDFNATVDGQPAKVSCHDAAGRAGSGLNSAFVYDQFAFWPVTWAPGQKRTIVFEYSAAEAVQDRWNLADRFYFEYIVRTGSLWRGNIGEADISITFRDNPRTRPLRGSFTKYDAEREVFRISYPEHAEWTDERTLRWQFKDWNPKQDITVERLQWLGLHKGYSFRLPKSYDGDVEKCTQATLDALVERELAPWKDAFPEEVKRFDRRALRSEIAACLYHEIAARHGKDFGRGKRQLYFLCYSYHGGWYKPRGEGKPFSESELNETERANRAFLRTFLSAEEARQ